MPLLFLSQGSATWLSQPFAAALENEMAPQVKIALTTNSTAW